MTPLPDIMLEPLARAALLEDLGRAGDITTDAVVPADLVSSTVLRARDPGVLAGIGLARLAFSAPGSDQRTMLALRRDPGSADRFPNDVVELQSYFQPAVPGQAVQAVPGAGLDVPIWLLGSSLYSAQLAAMLGLPFAFASHFAPDLMDTAIELYRGRFEPSDALAKPHVMLGVNVFAADTGREARRLFTSAQQQFMMLRRGQPIKLQPPVDSMDELWSPMEAAGIMRSLSAAVVGDRLAVRDGIERFIEMHRPDELMVAAQIYDHEARRHSFEMVAELQRDHVLA